MIGVSPLSELCPSPPRDTELIAENLLRLEMLGLWGSISVWRYDMSRENTHFENRDIAGPLI